MLLYVVSDLHHYKITQVEDYSAPVPSIQNRGKINGCSDGASCAGNHPTTQHPPAKAAQDTVLPVARGGGKGPGWQERWGASAYTLDSNKIRESALSATDQEAGWYIQLCLINSLVFPSFPWILSLCRWFLALLLLPGAIVTLGKLDSIHSTLTTEHRIVMLYITWQRGKGCLITQCKTA